MGPACAAGASGWGAAGASARQCVRQRDKMMDLMFHHGRFLVVGVIISSCSKQLTSEREMSFSDSENLLMIRASAVAMFLRILISIRCRRVAFSTIRSISFLLESRIALRPAGGGLQVVD